MKYKLYIRKVISKEVKSIITSMLSNRKLKKYRLKQTLSTTTGIRRHCLKRKNENLTKIERRSRNPKKSAQTLAMTLTNS